MKYLVLTDDNSRQYVFEIPDNGLDLMKENLMLTVSDKSDLTYFLTLLGSTENFMVCGQVFNSSKIVNVKIEQQ